MQKRLRSPWLTSDIIKCIRKKRNWYKLIKRNVIAYSSYKKYCSTLKTVLNLTEIEYYRFKFNSLNGNYSKNWKLLDNLFNINKKKV